MTRNLYKYPRTVHLPWSPGVSDDDLQLNTVGSFSGKDIVVTEKMDGENTTIYMDYLHARSIDGRHHPSRDWVKSMQGRIGHLIPEGWRICGENLYARHSIAYDSLSSYFILFSIWNEENQCLSWPETEEWAELLGLETPPVLYQGIWDEKKIRTLDFDTDRVEGYVVRVSVSFHYDAFSESVAKWVRKSHVQTTGNWMHEEIIPNKLSEAE